MDNKIDLFKSVYENNKSGGRSLEKYIKKHFPLEYVNIINYPLNIDNNQLWLAKLYNYLNNIVEIPKCLHCGNNNNFLDLKKGYNKFCSGNCVKQSDYFKNKVKETCLKKYGVDNPSKFSEIKEKISKNVSKTGEWSANNIKIKKDNKIKTLENLTKLELINYLKTNNKTGYKTRSEYIKTYIPSLYEKVNLISFTDNWAERLYCYLNDLTEKPKCLKLSCNDSPKFIGFGYGYNKYCTLACSNSDNIVVEKQRETYLNKHGDINSEYRTILNNRTKQTKLERHNTKNFNNIEKSKQTKLIRYGDENYNNREKFKQTKLERYGDENYYNIEKTKQTKLERYGDENYNNINKMIETHMNKYGVKIYNNREKSFITNLAKYGKKTYSETDESKILMYNKSINKWANKLKINPKNVEYNGIDFTIKDYCKEHETFIINKDVLKNRYLYGIENICTLCNCVSKHASIKEIEIKNFIEKDLNIKTDKIRIENKEIDIFIPSHNLGIEFDGLFWHSNVNIESDYHLNKTELCENNNIQLLHIFENEWIKKKEIVKSIIRSKLGKINNKIFARKCFIKEIDLKESTEFLEVNHIQGNVNSTITIGLYYNNELVSIMSFDNKSNVDDEYEMLRFSNKLNTVIVGGASKLLKYFIKTYQPKSILTFVDRRYSNGNLYKQSDFEFIENTKPNYFYFKSHEYVLYHSFTFRKDMLVKQGFDPFKTEYQIMEERKYYRIYDCGYMKYILKLV